MATVFALPPAHNRPNESSPKKSQKNRQEKRYEATPALKPSQDQSKRLYLSQPEGVSTPLMSGFDGDRTERI
jgi:hypothetical protein